MCISSYFRPQSFNLDVNFPHLISFVIYTNQIQGTILASPKISDWNGKNRKEWIEFNGINNLNVEGGGTIDGNGKVWWKKSCKVDKSRVSANNYYFFKYHLL